MPELPDEWRVQEPPPAPRTEKKAPKRKWQQLLQRPELAAELLTAKAGGQVQEDSAMSPKGTRRIHGIQLLHAATHGTQLLW